MRKAQILKPVIKIKKLTILNIRGIRRAELDLSSDEGVKHWALIFGDNGVGKSTILRCIAVALASKDAGLHQDCEGDWVRQGASDNRGTIEIECVASGPDKSSWTRKVTFESRDGSPETIGFEGNLDDLIQSESIFVAGYGPVRTVTGAKTPSTYRVIDAVYTLFDEETRLIDPENSLRRLVDKRSQRQEVLEWLNKVMMLPEGSSSLDSNGLRVGSRLQPDSKIVYGALSDGYRSVIALVSDFLGRAFQYFGEAFDPEDIGGIILVDELEQHLHPSWQRKIIALLHTQFPKVQFIATTHTPMCALGTTDLEDHEVELAVLEQTDNGSELVEDIGPPRGQTANNIFTSELFKMSSVTDDRFMENVHDYLVLKRKGSLNESSRQQFESLKKEISAVTSQYEGQLNDALRAAFRTALEGFAKETILENPRLAELVRDLIKDETMQRAIIANELGALESEAE